MAGAVEATDAVGGILKQPLSGIQLLPWDFTWLESRYFKVNGRQHSWHLRQAHSIRTGPQMLLAVHNLMYQMPNHVKSFHIPNREYHPRCLHSTLDLSTSNYSTSMWCYVQSVYELFYLWTFVINSASSFHSMPSFDVFICLFLCFRDPEVEKHVELHRWSCQSTGQRVLCCIYLPSVWHFLFKQASSVCFFLCDSGNVVFFVLFFVCFFACIADVFFLLICSHIDMGLSFLIQCF